MLSVLPTQLVALLLLTGTLASNDFINPQASGGPRDYRENQQYRVGDTMKIRWDTDYDKVSITLLYPEDHENAAASVAEVLAVNETSNSYDWNVNIDSFPNAMKDLAKSGLAIFYLGMIGPDGGNAVVKSHYFNVTAAGTPSRAPAMIVSSTSIANTPAATSATSTTTIIQTSHTSTPAPTDATSAPASVPIGAVIGGVLGGLAILCTFAFLVFRQIRKTSTPKPSQEDHEYPFGAAISMTSPPRSRPQTYKELEAASRRQTYKELEETSHRTLPPQELYAPPPPQYN